MIDGRGDMVYVKTTQDYIGVLDGSTRAPVSVYDASLILTQG